MFSPSPNTSPNTSPSTSPSESTSPDENGILGLSIYTIDYNNQIYILVGIVIILLLCCCSSLIMFMKSTTPMPMYMQAIPNYPGYQYLN
jgi:hypothetical protein